MQTQTGLIMGSPAYMSPEQCKDSADVDFRSDIYSFGVIMYEALSGRPPFVATSGTEMLVMQITAPPRPMRLPDVPAHVEAAVMRALAKDRSERFDSVAAFVSVLLGEGVATEIGFAGSPGATEDQAKPVPGPDPIAATPAVTTFSHSTGEMGTSSAGDEELLKIARPRRWPLVALGGLLGLGLALFLILRPGSGPGQGAGHTSVAVPAPAAAALQPSAPPAPPQARVAPPALLPSVPDAGAAVTSPTALHPAGKPPSAAAAPRPPSPAGERKRPASKKKDTEAEWELH
jgi:serine/threonine-protein kinase